MIPNALAFPILLDYYTGDRTENIGYFTGWAGLTRRSVEAKLQMKMFSFKQYKSRRQIPKDVTPFLCLVFEGWSFKKKSQSFPEIKYIVFSEG
jgi:hypothetical protein